MNGLLTLTEILMLAYWCFAGLVAGGVIFVDPGLMYSDYENPLVVAWNWSFLPIDVAFAVCGLSARFIIKDPARRDALSLVALTLMFCAGLMAVSFWSLLGWFDLTWWGINLWLVGLASVGIWRNVVQRSQKA